MMKFSLLCILLFSRFVLADNTVMEVIPLQNRRAAELLTLLTPMLDPADKVVADGANLIVKTTQDRLENMVNLIHKLDVRLNNLVVSVIQNSNKSAAELNAEMAKAASPDVIQMRGMNADTRDIIGNRISRLQTIDGHPAFIKAGILKSQQNANIVGTNGFNTGVTTSTQTLEASTGFAVTPRLTGQQVVVEIQPWSESFSNSGNRQTQAAMTSIRANLGEWVEIGGNASNQPPKTGMNTFNQSTHKNELRTLIKVDVDGGNLLYPNQQNTSDGIDSGFNH